MKKVHPPLQLSMQFEGKNTLASLFREGTFFVQIEYNTPLVDQPFASTVALAEAVARRAGEIPEIAGITVTDRMRGEDSHDCVAVAKALAAASGKHVLLHISGKGSTEDRIKDLLARAASDGIPSILAMTGDRSDKHDIRPRSRRVTRYAGGYLDSVDIIRLARRSTNRFLVGAAVNPYKYNPADVFAQYSKMVRKLGSGADFIATQVGWDMEKLQELQWYLRMREIDHPAIARLALLGAQDISRIHDAFVPGVHMSRTVAAMLQRECSVSPEASLATQLRRIGLQVAGCKLLGYNGVQVMGIRDVQTLDMVVGSIREALGEYDEYSAWVAAWREFHDFASFGPTPDAYYVFANLLDPAIQMYQAGASVLTDRGPPSPALRDRLVAATLPKLVSPKAPDIVARLARFVALRDTEMGPHQLRYCYYLSPAACPKRLVLGPCGGSLPDGTCEFGHAPCFFRRVLALALQRREPDRLEERIPE